MIGSLTIRDTLLLVVAVTLFASIPLSVHAQGGANDLRATIEASLLGDPRTSQLSEAQIDAVANVLVRDAESKGLTTQDIMWRPYSEEQGTGAREYACDTSSFLCKANMAFGFVGPDAGTPFILGVTSMALIWIFAEMLHRRSRREQNLAKS